MFTAGTTIKVNNKHFTILEVHTHYHYAELQGTLEGDASFLAGKRTIVVQQLTESDNGYKYDWNAK